MKKSLRIEVYNKFEQHCSYCGKELDYSQMQVDHFIPKANARYYKNPPDIDHIDNLIPSCRRCNHYKRRHNLKAFRELLVTLHERIINDYIFKVAIDYKVIKFEIFPFDGKFYFEKFNENKKGLN